MKKIVYNEGYKLVYEHVNPHTHNKYQFRKKFITRVDDEDYDYFLGLTSKNVPWCPKTPKDKQPFKSLDEYCQGSGLDKEEYIKEYIWQ